jgi:uncharacterized damage-inducible protein DinB
MSAPPPPVSAVLATLLARELRAARREVESYPDDAALWREVPGLPNAGGTLALHLAGNLRHYVGARLGGSGYVRDREREFAARGVPRAEVAAGLGAALDEVTRALAGLDDAGLALRYPEAVGGHELTTGEFLAHVLAHLAYHLGQLDYHRRAATGDASGVGAIALAEVRGGGPGAHGP